MIRASLCIAIVLASMLSTSTIASSSLATKSAMNSPNAFLPYHQDPNGTLAAFNATIAQFNLYTRSSTIQSASTNGTLTWISTLNSTMNGAPIPDTGFSFIVPTNRSLTPAQTVSWNLTIAKGNTTTTSPTYVRFDWNGTSNARTSATYSLFNGTGTRRNLTPFVRIVRQNMTIPGTTPYNSTGAIPLPCGSGHECVDVSKFIGYNMTLTFMFNSTSTGGGLGVRVANVEVASVQTGVTNSASHSMQLNPGNSTQVHQTGRLSLSFNSTVRFHNSANRTTWGETVVSLFIPQSYNLDNVTLSGNPLFPTTPPQALFGQGTCSVSPCTNVKFYAFNISQTYASNAALLVHAKSLNVITSLTPTVLGVPTTYFVPGDTMSVRMISNPGVNVSATQSIVLMDPNRLAYPGSTLATNKGGSYLYNVTVPVLGTPGQWTINGTFGVGGAAVYDLGIAQQTFTIKSIQSSGISVQANSQIGSGGSLNIKGTLDYNSNPSLPAQGVNATVFAIDGGATQSPITSFGSTSSGLYISNITLANGVFTVSQTMTMYFTVVNPTRIPIEPFNATVTIDHEWYASQTHGVKTTFNLASGDVLGDQGFTNPTVVTYRADITIGQQGVQLQLRSLASPASPGLFLTMSTGSSPVTSVRQHSGKFRITITSTNLGATPSTATSTTQAESPTYAFTLDSDLIPSRLLASSPTVPTGSDGSFSTSIISDALLGAKNLVLFAMGRDANGIVMLGSSPQTIQKTTFFNDSTRLVLSADVPSDVATGQSVTVTLSLKSNSSNLPMTLTVNLAVSGTPTPVSSQTVNVPPGSTKTVSFNFAAPSTSGAYLLTFTSSNYLSGTPLLIKTLQVSVLSGNLQILIPALIGVVIAILVLGYYATRRSTRIEEEEEERPRPSGKSQRPQPDSKPRNP